MVERAEGTTGTLLTRCSGGWGPPARKPSGSWHAGFPLQIRGGFNRLQELAVLEGLDEVRVEPGGATLAGHLKPFPTAPWFAVT